MVKSNQLHLGIEKNCNKWNVFETTKEEKKHTKSFMKQGLKGSE